MKTLPSTAESVLAARASVFAFFVLSTLLVFSAFFPAAALAWNATGHRLIAAIAWEEMTPAARETSAALLRRHPDHPRWLEKAGKAAVKDLGRSIFIEASTWADDIRNDKRFYSAREAPTSVLSGFPDMGRRSDWHYVCIPLNGPFDGKPLSGRLDRQLPELIKTMDQSDSEEERAYALPWLIHLVGDAHQPLHTSALPAADGRWDKSGTSLKVRNPFDSRRPVLSLHAFWDNLPGSARRGKHFDATARALHTSHTQANRSGDSGHWIKESWLLAGKKAYPVYPAFPAADNLPEISAAFYRNSQEIAHQRLAQAGFRLAGLLNRLSAKRVLPTQRDRSSATKNQ